MSGPRRGGQAAAAAADTAPAVAAGERRRVDKLSTVRIGSARYSVPRELIGRHVDVVAAEGEVIIMLDDEIVARHGLVAPGDVSIIDEHYGGPRRGPARAVRARSGAERAFVALRLARRLGRGP